MIWHSSITASSSRASRATMRRREGSPAARSISTARPSRIDITRYPYPYVAGVNTTLLAGILAAAGLVVAPGAAAAKAPPSLVEEPGPAPEDPLQPVNRAMFG